MFNLLRLLARLHGRTWDAAHRWQSLRSAIADGRRLPGAGAERASWFGAGVVVAAAGMGGYVLVVAPAMAAQAEPRPLPPRPQPPPVRVQVAGEVARPGAYDLPSTARVEDAVRLAGGPTEQADLSGLNQAAHLFDGQRVLVPRSPAATRTAWPTREPAAARAPPGTGTPWLRWTPMATHMA